jgi:hypothetical protein
MMIWKIPRRTPSPPDNGLTCEPYAVAAIGSAMRGKKIKWYVGEANPGSLHHFDLLQLIFAVADSKAVECARVRGRQKKSLSDDRRKYIPRPIQWVVSPTMEQD